MCILKLDSVLAAAGARRKAIGGCTVVAAGVAYADWSQPGGFKANFGSVVFLFAGLASRTPRLDVEEESIHLSHSPIAIFVIACAAEHRQKNGDSPATPGFRSAAKTILPAGMDHHYGGRAYANVCGVHSCV